LWNYEGIKAKQIVFCTGFWATSKSVVSYSVNGNKRRTFTIKGPELRSPNVIKSSVIFILLELDLPYWCYLINGKDKNKPSNPRIEKMNSRKIKIAFKM